MLPETEASKRDCNVCSCKRAVVRVSHRRTVVEIDKYSIVDNIEHDAQQIDQRLLAKLKHKNIIEFRLTRCMGRQSVTRDFVVLEKLEQPQRSLR